MIVMGGSLGGMKTLRQVLRGLPGDFPETIAVVLHRHRDSDDLLVNLLQHDSKLPVSEVVDKEAIAPGRVYLAPPDYHLLMEPDGFSLSTDDPVQFARPSIDVLFESAADTYGRGLVGVILTGANNDGAQGAARIQEKGGLVVVQDPATADGPAMPLAAIAATGTRRIFAPEQISAFLVENAGLPADRTP